MWSGPKCIHPATDKQLFIQLSLSPKKRRTLGWQLRNARGREGEATRLITQGGGCLWQLGAEGVRPASHACDFNSLSYGSVSPKQVNEATNEPMRRPYWSCDSLRCAGRMMDVGNVSGRDRWDRRWLPVRGILALSDRTKVKNLARITTQNGVETGFWDLWPCSHWLTDLLPIPTQLVPLIFTVIGKIRYYSAEFVRIKPSVLFHERPRHVWANFTLCSPRHIFQRCSSFLTFSSQTAFSALVTDELLNRSFANSVWWY